MLEKILNGLKKYSKGVLAMGLAIGALAMPVKANWINVKVNSALNGPSAYLAHYSAGSEGFDNGLDASNQTIQPNHLDIYSKTSLNPPYDKLANDFRGAISMTTFTNEIIGKDLVSSLVDANISVAISDVDGEENMINKKILADLYEVVDGNDVHKGTYDVWNMTESGQIIPLSVKNGLSHKLNVSFNYNNIADFNNDGDVNFKDYAMLAKDWKKGTGNYLTDISGPVGISDGNVDNYDLQEFGANWLQ